MGTERTGSDVHAHRARRAWFPDLVGGRYGPQRAARVISWACIGSGLVALDPMTRDSYYQLIAYGSFTSKRRYYGGARVHSRGARRTGGPASNRGVNLK